METPKKKIPTISVNVSTDRFFPQMKFSIGFRICILTRDIYIYIDNIHTHIYTNIGVCVKNLTRSIRLEDVIKFLRVSVSN